VKASYAFNFEKSQIYYLSVETFLNNLDLIVLEVASNLKKNQNLTLGDSSIRKVVLLVALLELRLDF